MPLRSEEEIQSLANRAGEAWDANATERNETIMKTLNWALGDNNGLDEDLEDDEGNE
ncbi:MAG: hypothetical protein HQL56_01000 [Magnetococcales bacterium]|nr:hypothetical protein [Magnetococcales bacterium]